MCAYLVITAQIVIWIDVLPVIAWYCFVQGCRFSYSKMPFVHIDVAESDGGVVRSTFLIYIIKVLSFLILDDFVPFAFLHLVSHFHVNSHKI